MGMGVVRVGLRPVVTCGRCCRQAIVEGETAQAGATAARRAGWAKDGRRWLCPLCHAQMTGTATPETIKERVAVEVSVMSDAELALLHGAVVAELRRRARP